MLACLVMLFALFGSACGGASGQEPLRAATGTIVVDTGLADALAEGFREEGGSPLEARAVGSGEAVALGLAGEIDLLLVHIPDRVDELLRSGEAVAAEPVARIRYVVAGPPDDPAGAAGAGSFVEAFRRIAREGATFVSRGDRSGTHRRELAVWEALEGRTDDYVETGQGQAESLRIADERGAYLLTDVATLLMLEGAVGLDALASDPDPWTVYEAVALPGPRLGDVRRFLRFVRSGASRELVGSFGGGVRPAPEGG